MDLMPNDKDRPQVQRNDCELLGEIFELRLGNVVSNTASKMSAAERAGLISRFVGLLRQLSSLMRVSDSDGSPTSLDSALERLMHLVSGALGADRSTLFLHDPETQELFSRVAQGKLPGEIRISAASGIAGTVFSSGNAVIIADAYRDRRFNPRVDELTGYRTRSVLCVPLRNWDNRIIGVAEVLNKSKGEFTIEDHVLLEALTSHAAAALESMRLYENIEKALHDEAQLLGITTALSSELNLDALLVKIMSITSDVLEADRSTLLLHDKHTRELRSKVAEGLQEKEIRIPHDAGIAGSVFCSGKSVNIPDAYADKRFNPTVDLSTGYLTRSILCVPVVTNSAEIIGIIQTLNKRGGPFNERDEKRLKALAAQASVAIENARLFEAVLEARNYSESILQSLSNGVLTLDLKGRIIKSNPAALRILRTKAENIRGAACEQIIHVSGRWISEALAKVKKNRSPEIAIGSDIKLPDGDLAPTNITIEPLIDFKRRPIGFMVILEDITAEKRARSTMARYMSPEIAERVLENNESLLGGQAQEVSILFSDIQNFTGIAENLGAQGTVSMLNEYFTEMAELVFHNGGMLDKYIGDAIMALFGTPFPSPNDAENAVTVAIQMIQSLRELNQRRLLEGHESIGIRLGISTGEVIAGNIGSPRRMDYTVIGHNVNIAARLESANKFYGTQIIIAESTRRKLTKTHQMRELDLIRVMGAQTPVAIYEILDGRAAIEYPHPEELIAHFSQGLRYFRRRDWTLAAREFEKTLSIWPGDQPSRLYLTRCARYRHAPPGDDWDGVWSMPQK